MSDKGTFRLHDLVVAERLTLDMETDNVTTIFDSILDPMLDIMANRPFFIGIDGSVTAGKSFLSSQLEIYSRAKNVNCTVIHGDWFMSSRKIRKQEVDKASSGIYNIADYDTAACNFVELARTIDSAHAFRESNESETVITLSQAYNRESGETDDTITIPIKKRSVVIFEGTGILSERQREAFDLSIRVDIKDYEETVKRLVLRESEKSEVNRLSDEFVTRRYNLIDWPYDTYLRSRDRKYFEYLIDTTNPVLFKLYVRNK